MSTRIVSSATFQERPWYVHGLNRLLPKGALEKDRLIDLARKRSGLKDFGQGYWEEPLDVLLRAMREEARLHPLGRFMMREQLVGRLMVRLQAEAWFRKHPEILEQELLPVWLIAGLQRTGTTKLQRLLDADPANRSLYSWESMYPVPLNSDWQKREKRIPQTRTAERAMRFLAPDFFAIHPVEYLQPEEDVLLLDVSFMSTSAEAMMNVPSYAAWLEQADHRPAYEYEARLLKLLQWQRKGERWVLKSPHHLEWLDVLCEVYPRVHIIWPHRPVHECVPSFMSMVAHGRAIFSREVDARAVGRHWLRKNARMLQKALAFREAQHRRFLSGLRTGCVGRTRAPVPGCRAAFFGRTEKKVCRRGTQKRSPSLRPAPIPAGRFWARPLRCGCPNAGLSILFPSNPNPNLWLSEVLTTIPFLPPGKALAICFEPRNGSAGCPIPTDWMEKPP